MAIDTKKMSKSLVAEGPKGGFIDQAKSWPERTKVFYNDVRTEMKKVTSPSLKEVQSTTAVVIITVFLFGLFFWGVDSVIGRAVDWLLRTLAHRG
jgi:preprotein translocase subunit SecE